MKFAEMLELYSGLDGAGQEKLLEEFTLQGQNGNMAALYLAGYLATPSREEMMESAIAGNDPELLLAYADYCAREYGSTIAGKRKVHAICFRGAKSSCAPLFNKLGVLTLAGCGCTRSFERAEKYFTKAARLGSAEARENLEFIAKHRDQPAVFYTLSQKEAVTAEKIEGMLPPQIPRVKELNSMRRFCMRSVFNSEECSLKIS